MKKNQDGYVLAYVLIVITILLALSAAVVTFSYQNLKKQVNAVNSSELTYEAEGSIEQFVSLLSAEEFEPEASTTTDTEGNNVTVTDDEGNIDYATTAPEELIRWATEEISIDGLFVSDSEIEVITVVDSSGSETEAVFLSHSTGDMLYDLEGNSLGEVTAYTAPSETTDEEGSTTTNNGSATVATASDDGTTTTTTYTVSADGVWTYSSATTTNISAEEDANTATSTTTVTIVISTGEDSTAEYTYTYKDNTLYIPDTDTEAGSVIQNADGTVTVTDTYTGDTDIGGTYEVTDDGDGNETWTQTQTESDGTVSVTLYLLAYAADEDSGTAEVSAELSITLTESTTTDDDGTETVIYTADYSYVSYET